MAVMQMQLRRQDCVSQQLTNRNREMAIEEQRGAISIMVSFDIGCGPIGCTDRPLASGSGPRVFLAVIRNCRPHKFPLYRTALRSSHRRRLEQSFRFDH
jgi:hypothetical protein